MWLVTTEKKKKSFSKSGKDKEQQKAQKWNSDSDSLESIYPDLHDAIVALATAGAGTDARRRTNVLNSCHT